MILGDKELRNRITNDLLVQGIELDQINPASVNLRLGDTWLSTERLGIPVNLGDVVFYKRIQATQEVIFPGEFLLATTKEYVAMPRNLSAFVQGRSSIGRIGLTVQNAGFIDPGFHGHITLELVNESPNPIILRAGYPVAQLVFFETSEVERPYRGKYNGQIEATGSRMYMDKEAREDDN